MNQLEQAQKQLKREYQINTVYIAKNGDVPAHLICNVIDLIWAMHYLNASIKKSEHKYEHIKNMIFKKGSVSYTKRKAVFEYYEDNNICNYF